MKNKLTRTTLFAASVQQYFILHSYKVFAEVNELVYKNIKGDLMTLQIAERKVEMINQVYRYICYENSADEASEMIDGEYRYVDYQGIYNDMNYSISVAIMVEGIAYNDNSTILRLKDYVTYDTRFNNGSGGYRYTVDFRGNTITDENRYTYKEKRFTE